MESYEISIATLAIIPLDNYRSKVIEENSTFVVNKTPMAIIEHSCRYFGSSFKGRHAGTQNLIGVSHKSPIIIDGSKEIIFFPTMSPRLYECSWIALKSIDKYKRLNANSLVVFKNGYLLELSISYGSLDNQVLRATRLESVFRMRKGV